jgi:hypothetical protein
MQEDEIKDLLLKYQTGKCTPEEIAFLEDWYTQWNKTGPLDLSAEEFESDLRAISKNIPTLHYGKQRSLWLKFAAASVLFFMAAGGYFVLHKQSAKQKFVQNQVNSIGPGGSKAVLTLSNGRKISLTDIANGKLIQQGIATINKTSDGKIIYHADHPTNRSVNALENDVSYNTLTTPRSGQYTIILADGTIVMLDAASSIKFPVSFNGNDRKVEITGQVYFEVVYNKNKPFHVLVNGQDIKDLGTHFNIKAYEDEPDITTTLIEGKLSISNNITSKILKPGQEAIVKQGEKSITVKSADVEESVAWKNGLFIFHQESLKDIMKTIARWYDVDIEYNGTKPLRKLGGTISKYKNINELLDNFKITSGIKYTIEGRRVILTN